MKLKSRLAPLMLAGIVALGVVSLPAVAADAAVPIATAHPHLEAKATTGKLVFQLVLASGKAYKKKVELSLDGAENFEVFSTNAKGAATFSKLKPATYTIRYYGSGSFLPVTKKAKVVAGKSTSTKLAVIAGASVAGTVKSPAGSALKGISVAALDKYGEPLSQAYTSSKGTYKLTGLKTGSYKVAFNSRASGAGSDLYDSTYWKKATTFESAASIKVTNQTSKKAASATKSVNGTITKLPTQVVAGTVSMDDATEVDLINLETGHEYWSDVVDGKFSVAAPYGDYKLSADTYSDYWDDYDTAWYSGKDLPSVWSKADGATLVLGSAGPISVVFIAPEAGGTDSDEGTASGVIDLAGVDYVSYASEDGSYSHYASVDDGSFARRMPVGSYRVSTEILNHESGNYEIWWYTGDRVTLSANENDAVLVEVRSGPSVAIEFGALPVR